MKGLTASKLGLARACPAFVAYPHVDTPTAAAEDGNERHAEQEAAIKRGDIPAKYAERWPGFAWSAEVAFAVDVRTGRGRELGVGIFRNYSGVTEDEIAGTADVVGFAPDRSLLVIVDKKSYDPLVDRAEVNAQVHVAALALCSAYGIDAAEVAIDHELRPFDVAEVDALSLASFAEDLRTIVADCEAARATPHVNPGSWCRYCPALHNCPATQQTLAVVEHKLESIAFPFSLDTDESAAQAFAFYERAKLLLARLREALYARAKDRPIPLSLGRTLGPHTKKGKRHLDGDVAYRVVRELHGQAIADAAVSREASQAGIKRALDFSDVKSKDAEVKRIVKEIEKLGGVTQKDTTTIEVYGGSAPQIEEASE